LKYLQLERSSAILFDRPAHPYSDGLLHIYGPHLRIQSEAVGAEVIAKCHARLYDLRLEDLRQRRSHDLNVEAGAA
jgi:hypothetical protein